MEISEKVIELKKYFENNPIRFEKETTLDKNLVNRAVLKICYLWNKSDGGRNFIKHLIEHLLPTYPFGIVERFTEDEIQNEVNRCAILNIKLAGSEELKKVYSEIRLKGISSGLLLDKEGFMDLYKKEVSKLPVELRKFTFAYKSSGACTKYLSGEATRALYSFVAGCMEKGEPEIISLRRKMLWEKTREMYSKPKPKMKKSSFGISDVISDDVLNKLKELN